VRLQLTLEQFNELNTELPESITICYEDNSKYYIETNDSQLIYSELSIAIDNLYSMTVEQFFESLPVRPDVIKLKQIGEQILDNFLNRNIEDEITSEQVVHTMERTKDIDALLRFGSLETALAELSVFVPDDMSEPFHWVNQQRIDHIINDITNELEAL